jgi:penicillin amidase
MKYQRIWFVYILFLFLLVVTGANAQKPVHTGELQVPGLRDRVEIFRDIWGVPHIYASNVYDLMFAQGFTQATDRWWQMEFYRHVGSGAIQELTGFNQGLMGTDRYLRTLGLRDLAQRELDEVYDDEARFLFQAFADGVNAYILSRPQTELAVQYNLLRVAGVRITVEPWTPIDTIIWGKMMAFNLASNSDYEELLSELYGAMDKDLLDSWNIPFPYGEMPTIIWDSELPITAQPTTRQSAPEVGIVGLNIDIEGKQIAEQLVWLNFDAGIGSNNWVVSGALTESGLPLMANDMHLGIQMPSIWYEIGLHCAPVTADCPYDVVGFALSPTPFIVAGHNADISWALTNVGPDTQDLYQIRVNPDNELQYEWDGEWRDMTVREETLYFGDGTDPITFRVRMTHLGPIVNDRIDGFNNDTPIAMRWTALEPGGVLMAFLRLNKASNWEEFREALSYWDSPAQNVIFADRNNNIGYQIPGKIPVRVAGHSGLLPVPGWTSEYEWLGYYPFDLLPRLYNPERGYIVTANQAVVPLAYYDQVAQELADVFGEDANYLISYHWDYGYRGRRINQLIETLAPHNIETFTTIHGDNFDGNAMEIIPILAEIPFPDDLTDMRDWLLEWDYQMHKDSPQAAFWAYFWVRLMDNLYNDEFAVADYWVDGNQNNRIVTRRLMSDPQNVWWDDVDTAGVTETRDEIVIKSFAEALDGISERLGDEPSAWKWGDLHTTTFVSNPLGLSGIAPIERQVNRGPFPTSGSGVAINATGWGAYPNADFSVWSGPSERVIYDFSDWDNSRSIHTTGQSGHPNNANYDDMIQPWINIQYRPMVFSREAVESVATQTLILVP